MHGTADAHMYSSNLNCVLDDVIDFGRLTFHVPIST
jgi:hypothetical protein